MKMIVDVDDLMKLKKKLIEINKHPLEDIVWVQNGNRIPVPNKAIEEWEHIGLSNTDFIEYVDFLKKDGDDQAEQNE